MDQEKRQVSGVITAEKIGERVMKTLSAIRSFRILNYPRKLIDYALLDRKCKS